MSFCILFFIFHVFGSSLFGHLREEVVRLIFLPSLEKDVEMLFWTNIKFNFKIKKVILILHDYFGKKGFLQNWFGHNFFEQSHGITYEGQWLLKEYKLPPSIFHGIPWGLTIFTIIFIQLWTTIKCQVITFTKTFIDFKIKTKRHISLKKMMSSQNKMQNGKVS